MTPIPISRKSPQAVRAMVAVLLMTVVLLLAAGCTSSSPAAVPAETTALVTDTPAPHTTRPVTQTIPPAVDTGTEPVIETTTEISESGSSSVTAPSANYHPEYIKVDATVYKAGEIVEFYLVNKGPEIKGCDYSHPPYTVYRMFPDGTRQVVATGDTARSYLTVIVEGEPASSTGPFTINTRDFIPTRYLIRFDCGNNVAREFVLSPMK